MCHVVSWQPFYMGIRNKWFVSGAALMAQTCWSYQLSNWLKIIGYIWIKYTVALTIKRFSKSVWYCQFCHSRAAEQAVNKTRAGKITVENVMLPPAHFRHHRKFFWRVSLMVLHCTMCLRHIWVEIRAVTQLLIVRQTQPRAPWDWQWTLTIMLTTRS